MVILKCVCGGGSVGGYPHAATTLEVQSLKSREPSKTPGEILHRHENDSDTSQIEPYQQESTARLAGIHALKVLQPLQFRINMEVENFKCLL